MKPISRGGRQIISHIRETQEISDFLSHVEEYKKKCVLHETCKIQADAEIMYTELQNTISILLDTEQKKHLIKILRVKEGELIRVIDPKTNLIAQGVLAHSAKNDAFIEAQSIGKSLSTYPKIVIGLPDQKVIDSLIEKLTEMGVEEIVFFQADYSQKKISHMSIERIIKKRDAAVKQSYSLSVPRISLEESLERLLNKTDDTPTQLICLYSPKDREELHSHHIEIYSIDYLLKLPLSNQSDETILFIGPEGGFSHAELSMLIHHRASFVSLGNNTLRVETAASVAIACVNSRKE